MLNAYETDTSSQLGAYIASKRAGAEYTGLLTDEAKDMIAECGDDLERLERQARAIHFFEHTLFG